jgi:Cof subfamily protein (haloacid dehalogenase superfamily)
MPNRPFRLLVLDVDGTVLDGRHEVSRDTAAAVRRAMDAGVRVVLATGRRYRDTLGVAEAIGVRGPLVTASGALVKDSAGGHATLYRASFGAGVLEGVLGRIAARGHEAVVYTDSFSDGFDFHCATELSLEPGIREYLELNRPVARVVPDLHERPPAGAFAGFTMGSREAMDAVEEDLVSSWPDALSLHVIRSPRYRHWMCEIAPAGVTKWSSVVRLAEGWGIEAAEICAVGDDVNDVPMLHGAGLGVAMGNATSEAIAAADRVAPTNDDGGVAAVVDWILA